MTKEEVQARFEHRLWITEANALRLRFKQAMGHATEALLRAERARGEPTSNERSERS